jgi:hypothetical protein
MPVQTDKADAAKLAVALARAHTDRAVRDARRLDMGSAAAALRIGAALSAERAAYEALCAAMSARKRFEP